MPKDNKENKHFFKDFKAELKKVIWPTPNQLINNTVAVVTIVIIVAILVFILDFIFGEMNTLLNKGVSSLSQSTTNTIVIDENADVNSTDIEVVTNEEVTTVVTNTEDTTTDAE